MNYGTIQLNDQIPANVYSQKIILASSSPRRAELLAEWGYDFEVRPPEDTAECGVCSGESPPELVARLAYQKAENVAKKHDSGLFLGCDTVGEIFGQALGKPRDREDAREMLTRLSGREHRVFSGVCLWRRPDDEKLLRVAETKLLMSPISEGQLEEHLDSDRWIGKAAGFGFQDGLDWVQILAGSESNVVGLPMELLAEMLRQVKED